MSRVRSKLAFWFPKVFPRESWLAGLPNRNVAPPTPEQEADVREVIRKHLDQEPRQIASLVRDRARQVFFVRLSDRDVVLKVRETRNPWSLRYDFVRSKLSEVGLQTASVLAASDSSDKSQPFLGLPHVIFERSRGISIADWFVYSEPPVSKRYQILRQVGEIFRRIHSVHLASGWGLLDDQGQAPHGSWSDYMNSRTLHGSRGSVPLFDCEWLERDNLVPGHLRATLRGVVESAIKPDEIGDARLVHGDPTLNNLLVEPQETRVSALVDLDTFVAADPALDFARLQYRLRGEDEGYMEAFWEGYGETDPAFQVRAKQLTVCVMIEKISWLRQNEGAKYALRVENDVAYLERLLRDFS